jgi:hypothetical protein
VTTTSPGLFCCLALNRDDGTSEPRLHRSTNEYQVDSGGGNAMRITAKRTVDMVLEEMDPLEDGARGFEEGAKILIATLNELSQIHPFIAGKLHVLSIWIDPNPGITVPVLAFNAVRLRE